MDLNAMIKLALEKYGIAASQAEMDDFQEWMVKEAWNKYQQQYMDIRQKVAADLATLPIVIANGMQDKPYMSASFTLLPEDEAYDFEFEGLEDLGLEAVKAADGTYTVQGRPNKAGDFYITLRCKCVGCPDSFPPVERKIPYAVNANPRLLWNNIPTDPDVEYYKPDTDHAYVRVPADANGCPRKDMAAASMRGRSHAHTGKPRDDDFRLWYDADSQWYVMAVADGAGSAEFSRKGSEIACQKAVERCAAKLDINNCLTLEQVIVHLRQVEEYSKELPPEKAQFELASARKLLADSIYGIVGQAAFAAHKSVMDFAAQQGREGKSFATTLLLAICKKFDFGWFIATFWVGDGAIGLYNKEKGTLKLLGIPDEGEFSGQTRFLTMPEVMRDPHNVFGRLRYSIEEDFTALMLMTDGVSDPMFGTDAKLRDPAQWEALWQRLQSGFPDDGIAGIDLSDDNDYSLQLLDWLNFWMPGEHDDRTIAILH